MTSTAKAPCGRFRISLSVILLAVTVASPLRNTRGATPDSGQVSYEESLTLDAGQTLLRMLASAGVERHTAVAAARALETVFDPTRLQAGQSITLEFSEPGELTGLRLYPDAETRIVVDRGRDGRFRARSNTTAYEVNLAARVLTVGADLNRDAEAAGVPGDVLDSAMTQLGRRMDLQRDLKPGDTLALVFRVYRRPGTDDGHPGELLHATWRSRDGDGLSIYRFRDVEGHYAFYDSHGVSLAAELLRTPVRGGHISSLYGPRRHPILGYTRMHRGLDFAAPWGSPVMAAGDGVIVTEETNGDYGNYVRIRHNARLSTAYAHLSVFSATLVPGDHVRQGQVIGYVGQSGLATGPHLHYEVLVNDEQVNPSTVSVPPRRILKGGELLSFRTVRDLLDQEVARAVALHDDRPIARGDGR